MEYHKPETVEQYLTLVQGFAGLADVALSVAERELASGDTHSIAGRLPGLVSIVNIIGYLRGQDGFFVDSRPQGASEHQRELYMLEDAFEARLQKLIEAVRKDPTEDAYLKVRLQEYYSSARFHF